jgi:hypothetical protein
MMPVQEDDGVNDIILVALMDAGLLEAQEHNKHTRWYMTSAGTALSKIISAEKEPFENALFGQPQDPKKN